MSLSPNQFNMIAVAGDLDLKFAGSVITARVSANTSGGTALVAGQAVKMEDATGGVPPVLALTANTQSAFGFVIRTLQNQNFPTGHAVEVAMAGSVMNMVAGAAIARGAKLEVVYTTNKVITNAGTNPVCGFALDKAAADGDIIRVYILSPSYELGQVIADISGLQAALDVLTANDVNSLQTFKVTATTAEINAGKEIVPAVTGKKIRVVNYAARVVGNFAATTSVDLQDSAATKVTALGVTGLTNGAVMMPTTANTTLGAGFAADLLTSSNLVVANTGSAATTGTSITFTVTAQYV